MIPKEDRWRWIEMKINSIFWDIQLIKEKLGKELYFKWLAKEDEPLTDLLRPSLQPKQ